MADEVAPQRATAAELAKRHGQHQGAKILGDDPFTALHNIAVVLNGWAHHEVTTGEIVTLTDEEYLAAIECAKVGEAHPPVNRREPVQSEPSPSEPSEPIEDEQTEGQE